MAQADAASESGFSVSTVDASLKGKVKTCKICRNTSDSKNPIIFGPDSTLECLPWLYGPPSKPEAEGNFCKPCYTTFLHAGFKNDEVKNVKDFIAAIEAQAKRRIFFAVT